MQSRYFSCSPSSSPVASPTQQRDKQPKTRRRVRNVAEDERQVLAVPTMISSRFFLPPPRSDVSDADSGLSLFRDEFLEAMLELYRAKPILIQEHVSSDPWKVLVAATLLNKTAGKLAVPVFFDIIGRWPTPAALARAPLALLQEVLRDLGFGRTRAQRLRDISHTFLVDPPDPSRPRPSRGHTTALFLPSSLSFRTAEEGSGPRVSARRVRYPPTPVSHVPGCGPYALDSYRIFCPSSCADEWRAVRPSDKELVRYLRWRWAVDAYRTWDAVYGPGESIDLAYVRELTATLRASEPGHEKCKRPTASNMGRSMRSLDETGMNPNSAARRDLSDVPRSTLG